MSYYAIQIAKLAGLKVYTTASKHHHDALTALGADVVFDYRDSDVVQKIRNVSGGKIRVAIDPISESGSTELTAKSLSDAGGKVVICKSFCSWQACYYSDVVLICVISGTQARGRIPLKRGDRVYTRLLCTRGKE